MTVHRGHCRCEGVVVQINVKPDFSVYCHCDDCRRATGAPVLAAIGVLRDAVTWEADASLSRHVNDTCTRSFCNVCGSPVAQEHESAQDRIFFNTGFMDKPEKFPPTYHSFAGQQINWLKLADDLPRHEKTILIKSD